VHMRRRWTLAVVGVVLLAVPVILNPSVASAGPKGVPIRNFTVLPAGTRLNLRTTVPDGTSDFPGGAHVTEVVNGNPYEKCIEAEPLTAHQDGGFVHVNFCDPSDLGGNKWWQWEWRFEPTRVKGLYRIHVGAKCVDADNSNGLENGARIQMWECLGGGQHNQYWWMVDSGIEIIRSDGSRRKENSINMVSNANGRCLSIDNSRDLEPYSQAVLLDCQNDQGQRFSPFIWSVR
jgi:hypothetical protein